MDLAEWVSTPGTPVYLQKHCIVNDLLNILNTCLPSLKDLSPQNAIAFSSKALFFYKITCTIEYHPVNIINIGRTRNMRNVNVWDLYITSGQ